MYLGASVPTGLLVSTVWGTGEDVREAGSGNIGATNVFRTHGGRVAAAVLALDLGKGWFAVLLARALWPEGGVVWEAAAGLTAFVGHCLPIFLAFRGGKGVATGAGVMLALAPGPCLVAIGVWVLLLRVTGRSSVASLAAAAALVVAVAVWAPQAWVAGVPLALGVGLTHTGNLRRLVEGSETPVIAPVQWGRPADAVSPAELLERGPAGQPLSTPGAAGEE